MKKAWQSSRQYFQSRNRNSDEYQRGGIVDDDDRVLPEDQWTTRLEEPMIDWARSQVGGDADVYLFGSSAGAQFLSRVAAYERPQDVTRFVVASPSTWVLPSLTEDGPTGLTVSARTRKSARRSRSISPFR
jgi:pimeloyl-ACP methyl ester carboxylesterase